MKRRTIMTLLVCAAWLLAAAGLEMLNAIAPQAEARAAIPAPAVEQPRQDAAVWTVGDSTFESNYPGGFSGSIEVSSSAGTVERVRLIWHRTTLRPDQVLNNYAQDAEFNPDTGQWEASWEPSGIQMLPPWVVINFHWEMRDSAGNVYETVSTLAEYADHTRTWTRSESENVVVLASDLPESLEAMILDAMAQQSDQYLAVWGAPLPYKPRVILFGNFDAWKEWRTADHNVSETSLVVGQTFDEWGAIVQVLYGADLKAAARDLAYSTVVHETEHLYQAEFLANRRRFDIPGWFIEGDASFFELEPSYDYEGRVRQEFAQAGRLPPLLVGLADAPRVDGPFPRDGYDIGYSFFTWLYSLHGDLSAHHDIMALLAEDVPFFDALEQVIGMPTAEIEREWRLWLGASEAAATLIPTWTPFFPVLGTPEPQ